MDDGQLQRAGEVAEGPKEMFSLSSTVQPQVSPGVRPIPQPSSSRVCLPFALLEAVSPKGSWQGSDWANWSSGGRKESGIAERKRRTVKRGHAIHVMGITAGRVDCVEFLPENLSGIV